MNRKWDELKDSNQVTKLRNHAVRKFALGGLRVSFNNDGLVNIRHLGTDILLRREFYVAPFDEPLVIPVGRALARSLPPGWLGETLPVRVRWNKMRVVFAGSRRVAIQGYQVLISSTTKIRQEALTEQLSLRLEGSGEVRLAFGLIGVVPIEKDSRILIRDWCLNTRALELPKRQWLIHGSMDNRASVYDGTRNVAILSDFPYAFLGCSVYEDKVLLGAFRTGLLSHFEPLEFFASFHWSTSRMANRSSIADMENRPILKYPSGYKAAFLFTVDLETLASLIHSTIPLFRLEKKVMGIHSFNSFPIARDGLQTFISKAANVILKTVLHLIPHGAFPTVRLAMVKKVGVAGRRNAERILQLSERYNVPITWFTDIHGLLHFCKGCKVGVYRWASKRNGWPNDFWVDHEWMCFDPQSDYKRKPEWYFGDIVHERLLGSPVPQEVGTHTATHLHAKLASNHQFQQELKMWKATASVKGIACQSMSYPWDIHDKEDLLIQEGIIGFRIYDGQRHPNANCYVSQPLLWRRGLVALWLSSSNWHSYKNLIDTALKTGSVCVLCIHPHLLVEQDFQKLRELFSYVATIKRNGLWTTTVSDLAQYVLRRVQEGSSTV